MAAKRYNHFFDEVPGEKGADVKALNSRVQKHEKDGCELVSVTVSPKTNNWVLLFRYFDGEVHA